MDKNSDDNRWIPWSSRGMTQPVQKLQQFVEESCFATKNGSFLANVSAPGVPSASLEGKWTQDYTKLDTQLLDPTGRVIQLNPLAEVVSKFGAQGLRRVMCGYTAFSNTLTLEGHKVVIKNYIRIIRQTRTQTVFETKSEFYYGLFALMKSGNTLFWRGRIENTKVTPEMITFGSGKEFLTFDFIDYD